MSFGAVLDNLADVLREATEARQFLQHGVIPRLEAIENVQNQILMIVKLTLRADTDAKELAAWRRLAEERGEATEKLNKVREILETDEYECDCSYPEGHVLRCLACRIGEVVGK